MGRDRRLAARLRSLLSVRPAFTCTRDRKLIVSSTITPNSIVVGSSRPPQPPPADGGARRPSGNSISGDLKLAPPQRLGRLSQLRGLAGLQLRARGKPSLVSVLSVGEWALGRRDTVNYCVAHHRPDGLL